MSKPLYPELIAKAMARDTYWPGPWALLNDAAQADLLKYATAALKVIEPEVERLRAELARRDEQIAAVRELHAATRVDRLGDICYECGGRSCPCPTIEALDGGAS